MWLFITRQRWTAFLVNSNLSVSSAVDFPRGSRLRHWLDQAELSLPHCKVPGPAEIPTGQTTEVFIKFPGHSFRYIGLILLSLGVLEMQSSSVLVLGYWTGRIIR